jgi:hypothetical protein
MSKLSDTDILALDYDGKVKMLEQIIRELVAVQADFAVISGRYAEARAKITVLKEIKSALQSAIRAESN